MKIFKTDLSMKYFLIKTKEKDYFISFRIGLLKGFHDIEIKELGKTKKGSQYHSVILESVETSPSLVGTIKWLASTGKYGVKSKLSSLFGNLKTIFR